MPPETWEKLKTLFEGALNCTSAEERLAFIEKHCAHDPNVRSELESLLAEHERMGNFIEAPAPGLERVGLRWAVTTMEGRQIGPYRLERKLGHGGMGTVYLAVRADDQYHKQVAIKLLRPGAESRDLLRRFLAERQILAGLDHPNIARLLDGGTTEEGEPYLVMDYIDGLPIDRYCREHALALEERLKLFTQVCSAVEYAHRNSIVHRDIKPGNILVTADGIPKLLDFGIAKLLRPEDLLGGTLATTETEFRIMTPEYASPEQIRGDPITTASDLYSLVVVLYELLTDKKPYKLKSRLLHEVARVICEEQPEPPSAAVSRPAEAPEEPAGTLGPTTRFRTGSKQGRKLRRKLRGDVDMIVLMALRKEPRRRYGAVADFAQDLDRHLRGLPVRARKETLRYRAVKFIGRNRVAAGIAALLAVMALAAALAAAWQANLARQNAAEAGRQRSLHEKTAASLALRQVWAGDDVDAFGSVSRDGRYLTFTDWSTGDLAIRDLETGQNRRITNHGEPHGFVRRQALYSVFSPAGKQVAYTWLDDRNVEVRICGIDGSNSHSVWRSSGNQVFRVSDWSASGVILGTLEEGQSSQMALLPSTGTLRTLEQPQRHGFGRITFSSDGRLILHEHPQEPNSPNSDVFVYALDSGADSPMVRHPADDFAIGWLPGRNTILFGSDRTGAFGLWAADGSEPQLLRSDVGRIEPLGITDKSALYYANNAGLTDVYLTELDPAATTVLQASRPLTHRFVGMNRFPVWSPDGRFLLYQSQRGPFETALVLRPVAGGAEREIHPPLKSYRRPLWDRNAIVVAGSDGAHSGIYRIEPVSGKTALVLSAEDAQSTFPPAWSSDGKTIFNRYSELRDGVYRMSLASRRKTVLYRPPEGAVPTQ